jgi:PTS system mannose-specific IIB component/fructoselysine and glucoselysine-specific PTS system IIB component
MPLDLFRIDERLLHGQVIVGWGERLGIEYYLVVDDDLAASEWEQELYESGMSDSTTVVFASVEETVRQFAALDARKGRGALLTRDTAVMRDLADRGLLADRSVNVGAIHMGDGRRKALDYVYLGDEEAEDLKAIARQVATVSARDLPSSRQVPLKELLHAAGHA